MAETLKLKVVTPKGSSIDMNALSVTACSEVGEFCILPQHRPILASLRAGRFMVATEEGDTLSFVTNTGFIEGGPGQVNVLTSECVNLVQLDGKSIDTEIGEIASTLLKLSDSDRGTRAALENRLAFVMACQTAIRQRS